jgi:putative acetyltransferase
LAIRIEVIRSSKAFLELDTKGLLSHINSLIGEHAYILTNHPFNMKEEAAWKHLRAHEIAQGDKLIVLARDGRKVAGICEVKRGRGKEKFNMGFSMSVDRQYRGQGIGEALMRRAIREGKSAFKPHKIYLYYEDGNANARKLYQKVGFCQVARLKGYVFHCGKFIDRILMEYMPEGKHGTHTRRSA